MDSIDIQNVAIIHQFEQDYRNNNLNKGISFYAYKYNGNIVVCPRAKYNVYVPFKYLGMKVKISKYR